MKTKNIFLTLAFLFISFNAFSQQIGTGHASSISDFSVFLKSGVYEGLNAAGRTPDDSYGGWQHLFVSRHSNINNNFQLQLASSYALNDKLFFRKIENNITGSNNGWIELATRGANTFNGNQNVNGRIYASTSSIEGGSLSLVNPSKTGSGMANEWVMYNMTGAYGNSMQFWNYGTGLGGAKFTILDNGNVGIGTQTPSNVQSWAKVLDVSGAGNSKILSTTSAGLKTGVFTHDSWYGGGGFIGTESDNNLHILTGYSPKVSVLTNGNVGIGTTGPASNLEISKLNSNLNFDVNTNSLCKIYSRGWNASIVMQTFQINGTENSNQLKLNANGYVGIGVSNPDEKLTVNGSIHAKEVRIDTSIPADYVFQKYYTGVSKLKADYVMPTLEEVAQYTKENNHLPNIPSAEEMKKNGVKLGEMNNLLLQKIEELTLYAIEQNKKLTLLETQIKELKENKK
jgi:hypothetical protein